MKRFAQFLSLFVFVLFLTGCATVQTSTVTTRSDYKKVWNACIDSLPDVRFSASSTDFASGLIIADQAVVSGHGTVSRLNIRVQKGSSGTVVVVKYVPPPGTIGGAGTAERYIKALKERLPDLDSTIINNDVKMEKSAQQEIKERDNPSVSSNQEDGKQRTSKPPLQVTANVGSNQDDSKRITPKDMTNDNLPVRYLIVTKKTNIRAEDKTKSKIITTPKLGERVEKLDASDKWFKVRTAEGKSGWIIKSAVIQAE